MDARPPRSGSSTHRTARLCRSPCSAGAVITRSGGQTNDTWPRTRPASQPLSLQTTAVKSRENTFVDRPAAGCTGTASIFHRRPCFRSGPAMSLAVRPPPASRCRPREAVSWPTAARGVVRRPPAGRPLEAFVSGGGACRAGTVRRHLRGPRMIPAGAARLMQTRAGRLFCTSVVARGAGTAGRSHSPSCPQTRQQVVEVAGPHRAGRGVDARTRPGIL